jgi:predicted transcriptional regulator
LLDLITIKEEGGNRKRINITPFGNSFLEGVRKYMKISKSSDKEQSKEVTRITKLLKSSN